MLISIGSDQCYYCYLQSCAPTEKCMECGMTVTLYQLREHRIIVMKSQKCNQAASVTLFYFDEVSLK